MTHVETRCPACGSPLGVGTDLDGTKHNVPYRAWDRVLSDAEMDAYWNAPRCPTCGGRRLSAEEIDALVSREARRDAWLSTVGAFDGDPVYAEVAEAGRQIRAQSPDVDRTGEIAKGEGD